MVILQTLDLETGYFIQYLLNKLKLEKKNQNQCVKKRNEIICHILK